MKTLSKTTALFFISFIFISVLKAEKLQVPSPDWRDQIIYFIMTDRFNDGNPENNNWNCNEYDPKDSRKFSGGDIKGITDKIEYIKNLGATSVWITPPIANQWWDPIVQYGGYHGYWGVNFKELDRHFGTLNEYKELSDALHKNGMYLIQDIVPNHTGNFFDYKGDYKPDTPEENFENFLNTPPVKAPTQYPFNLNNVNNEKDRKIAAYHWTPIINNFEIPEQRLTYQLANLDDINTGNPLIRQILKETYSYWIREVGVDAFRIDTVIYVEHDFWNDFISGKDGINEQAKTQGKNNFFTFGEAFVGSEPMKDNGEKEISSYLGTKDKPEMNAVLNFPLYFTINKVFAEGQPTSLLTYRLNTFLNKKFFPNPYIIPKFLDNHDVPRFLSKGSIESLKQALAFLFTTPGIPVIYYATEQGFKEQRASMFKNGWGSDNINHFNQDSDLYKFIRKMISLRKSNKIFSRGKLSILADSKTGPGIFSYSLSYKNEEIIVLFNTSPFSLLIPDINTRLPAGSVLEPLYTTEKINNLTVGKNGMLTTVLSAKSILIFKISEKKEKMFTDNNNIRIISELEDKILTESTDISGEAETASQLLAVIDGNLDNAIKVDVFDKKWSFTLKTDTFATGKNKHILIMYDKTANACSEPVSFYSNLEFNSSPVKTSETSFEVNLKKYGTPQDKSYTENLLEIQNVKIFTVGTNLKISIKMNELSQLWNPQNGFDHVCFNLYIDLPDNNGCSILPRINSKTPKNFKWNYMSFSQGWTNALYSYQNATESNWGKPAEPAPKIEVDKNSQTISLIYTPQALGYPKTLKGTKIFITTWDYDNGYRKLTEKGGPWSFSGGNESDPLIFNCSPIIEIN